jgi:hypothetical protein
MPSETSISDDLKSGALDYHRLPRPGKVEIQPTKRSATNTISPSPTPRASPPHARRSLQIRCRQAN